MTMYLIKLRKQKGRAHIWNGVDTLCRMASTGGLGQKIGYVIRPDAAGRPVCQLCANRAEREAPANE